MKRHSYGVRADTALRLWVKLARAYGAFGHRTAEDIRTYGLTAPQFGVLEALGHKGPLTLGNLSRKMLRTGGNITVIVDNLVRQGLVERRRCPTDNRVMYARLSPRGHRLLRRIFPRHAAAVTRLASVLSQAEQRRLAALLKKLGTAMQDPAAGGKILQV